MLREIDFSDCLQSGKVEKTAESLARLCTLVRDCPFEHVKYERHYSYGELINDFVKRRRGACSVKHYFLGEALINRQFKVRYITTPFLWKDMPIDYPTHLKRLADLMPVQLHLSLEAESNGITVPIDVTWDKELKRAGFPINHFENGINASVLAVKPADESVTHESGIDRFLFIESVKSKMKPTGIEPSFYEELNLWLNDTRLN